MSNNVEIIHNYKNNTITAKNNNNNDIVNIFLETSSIYYNNISITENIYYETMNPSKINILILLRKYIFDNKYTLKNYDNIISSLRRLTGGIYDNNLYMNYSIIHIYE